MSSDWSVDLWIMYFGCMSDALQSLGTLRYWEGVVFWLAQFCGRATKKNCHTFRTPLNACPHRKRPSNFIMRWDLFLLFTLISVLYIACILTVHVADIEYWDLNQRIGSSVVMTIMFVGFSFHFYLSNFTSRK